MNVANSAKALRVLGATLILLTAPNVVFAGIEAGNVNGIEAGNVTGIEAGNVTGIEAGNVTGIEAGNVLGIEAGNVTGIEAGNVTGIEAGNVTGIEAGNVTGIEAGNVLGIEAGNVLGIEAGNVTGIEAGNITGIEAGNITGIEAGNVLIGPIDSIDSLNGVFDAMGQSVMVSAEMLSTLNVGDLVAVEGSVVGPGLLYADSVTVSSEQYVAGATEVFVTGILSSIDASTGTATLGTLRVDYTSSLASGRTPAGVVWSFRGTQPSSRGVMLSDRVQAF